LFFHGYKELKKKKKERRWWERRYKCNRTTSGASHAVMINLCNFILNFSEILNHYRFKF